MTMPGILGIYAHPDDESFGPAGAIAGYALNGTPVDVLCATRGEAGQTRRSARHDLRGAWRGA